MEPLEQGDSYFRESQCGNYEEHLVTRPAEILSEEKNRPGEQNGCERDVQRMLERDPEVDGRQ